MDPNYREGPAVGDRATVASQRLLSTGSSRPSSPGRAGWLLPLRPFVGLGRFGWSLPFFNILAIAAVVYLVAFWVDVLAHPTDGDGAITLRGLVHSLIRQDVNQARNTLNGLGEVMAAVLGLALTVSSIIVQLAATRFTPYITNLFFRARANQIILGFFVTSSIYVLWVNFSLGPDYVPQWGVALSMVLMTMSLLLLFPYFSYVFDFLDPEKIVGRIMDNGLSAAGDSSRRADSTIDARQARVVDAVEQLANIGLNALQQKDKNIASEAVDALAELGIRYGDMKIDLGQPWRRVRPWNRQSPDFVSLSDQAIVDLQQRGTWVEWKLLRQYQMLFVEALGQIKDTCYLVAINTRKLGESAAQRGDLAGLELTIKFFNTYLRATLNASDVRTAYNILHQYRQLAECLLDCPSAASDDDSVQLERRSLEIAKYMRYYSSIAFSKGATFVTEVIAHDISALCELAFVLGRTSHDELLQVFLAVDQHAETVDQEKSLRGVRRAQIKLATTYLLHGADHLAQRIADDMAHEPSERMRSLWQELQSLEHREFWEVNDRGTNFDYLTDAQKDRLPQFFGWFPQVHETSAREPSKADIDAEIGTG